MISIAVEGLSTERNCNARRCVALLGVDILERRISMTLSDVKAMDLDVISPDIVAQVLRCNPNYIRTAAKQRPELLGFPVIIIGNRVKIPRVGFIRYMEGMTSEQA